MAKGESTFEDLFSVSPNSGSSSSFDELLTNPQAREYREWISELWLKFQPVSPRDFALQFRNDEGRIESAIWEMALACQLKKSGLNLIPVSSGQPDICLSTDNENRIWIECNLPQAGKPDLPDSVKPVPLDGNAHLRGDTWILRLTNAIDKKIKQHSNWLTTKVCGDSEPFIIAIHTRNLLTDISADWLPDAARSVFPLGAKELYVSRSGEPSIARYSFQPQMHKANGLPVEKQYFASPKHKQISGVLVSDEWWGYAKSTGVYYSYIVNPFAANPIDPQIFPFAQTCNSLAQADGTVLVWID